jgi:hypothetical protein
MTKTAENGFLPAFTADQLAEVSVKYAHRHDKVLSEFCHGDFDTIADHLADLAQAFALGACEAASRAKDGQAVRSLQWKYGEGYMLKRLHVILSDTAAAAKNVKIDTSGGAFHSDEDSEEETGGYVPETGGAMIDAFVAAEMQQEASKALAELPADIQEIVQLHAIEGLSLQKIAKMKKTNSMNVWYKYQEGMKILRRAVAA